MPNDRRTNETRPKRNLIEWLNTRDNVKRNKRNLIRNNVSSVLS